MLKPGGNESDVQRDAIGYFMKQQLFLSALLSFGILGLSRTSLLAAAANSGFQLATVAAGTTSSGSPTLGFAGPSCDFNGDGMTDMVWQGADGFLAFYTMRQTAAAFGFTPFTVPAGWEIVATADVNGDRQTDLVLTHSDGSVAYWLMNGMTITQGRIPYKLPGGWRIAGSGDFNTDGHSDLLLLHSDSSVAVWFLEGIVVKRGVVPFKVPAGWRIILLELLKEFRINSELRDNLNFLYKSSLLNPLFGPQVSTHSRR